MKHRLKGLLALVLSLVMVFALATNAWAVDYNIWVSGTQVNDANAANVLAGDAANDGKVIYDAANNTLTLNGVTISGSGEGIHSSESLTLQLMGSNKVDSSSSGSGIFVDGGTLTITGDGSLEAAGMSYGIANTAGTIIIENATVTATGTYNEGIHATGDLTITDATVTATGDSGIYAYTDVTIEDSTVTATGDDGRGIHTGQGNITISGGTVKATGKEFGIYANNGGYSGGMKVTISGGSVEAYATDDSDGIGIYAPGYDGEIAISGDNTQVTVGCATGLQADIVNIAGGSTVSIEAKNANNENAIISGELNMSGDYQWSTDGIAFNNSTTLALSKDAAKGTAKFYIKPLSGSTPGNTNPYPPIIYNPTPTPEPEKVDSAKTFDAGIGLYVTMSVLSATGSAFLFKKKD